MPYAFFLLGKLRVNLDQQPVRGLESYKTQELLAYLLLHPTRAHHREMLASQLWGEVPTAKSLKYLRQALWELQLVLPVVRVEAEWIEFKAPEQFFSDVVVFDRAAAWAEGRDGASLAPAEAGELHRAIQLYSDLLSGWQQEWCLLERERLYNEYVLLLDKLMDFSLARQQTEAGLAYGTRLLAYDWARESTHRRMMRLYHQAGDRTAALRQYERCRVALKEELGIHPDHHTRALYEAIRDDRLEPVEDSPAHLVSLPPSNLVLELQRLQALLLKLQRQVAQELRRLELPK